MLHTHIYTILKCSLVILHSFPNHHLLLYSRKVWWGKIRGKFRKLPVICQARLVILAALLNHQAIVAKCSKKSKFTKLSPHQIVQQCDILIIIFPFISDNNFHNLYGSYLADKFYYACKHPIIPALSSTNL